MFPVIRDTDYDYSSGTAIGEYRMNSGRPDRSREGNLVAVGIDEILENDGSGPVIDSASGARTGLGAQQFGLERTELFRPEVDRHFDCLRQTPGPLPHQVGLGF